MFALEPTLKRWILNNLISPNAGIDGAQHDKTEQTLTERGTARGGVPL